MIKFNNINSNDFYDKIRPYEVIIPINLYDEILEYHLVIKPKLCIYNSKIIKPKLVNVFINWIDKELKDPIYIRNEYDPIYKFKLIYHGKPNEILSNNNNNNNSSNEDSFANLILIKTKGSNTKNFGGYNSHGFDHQNFKNISFYRLSDNFIFSFIDNEYIQNIKISRIKPFQLLNFFKILLLILSLLIMKI